MNFMKVFDSFGKKFEIIDADMRTIYDHYVYRIRALRDIERYGVKKGDLGGYVTRESNLSHEGDCWVASAACVTGLFEISGDALVTDCAAVSGHSKVAGNTVVKDSAKIEGMATVTGDAQINGCSVICDNATIQDNAVITDSYIGDMVVIAGDVELKGVEILNGSAEIKGNIKIGKYERNIWGYGG